jgi:hypothetical protein
MGDVRLVAALAWYEEPPASLERLVVSLAGVVDALVACDGRWHLMPGESTFSPIEQAVALSDACEQEGIEYFAYGLPVEAYATQVAKRDALMAAAAEHGDWILVIDGDELIEHADGMLLRALLAETALDVADVMLRTLNRPWPYQHLAPMAAAHRRIYRTGTRVAGPAHNDYTFGDRRLNGSRVDELAPALDLAGEVTITHDNRSRPKQRNAAGQIYRRARRQHGIEVYA